jgi:hypothetical protein
MLPVTAFESLIARVPFRVVSLSTFVLYIVLIIHLLGVLLGVTLGLLTIEPVLSLCLSKLVYFSSSEAGEHLLSEGM